MQPNLVARQAGREAHDDYAAWAASAEGLAAGGDSVAWFGSDIFGADRLRDLGIAPMTRDADRADAAFARGFTEAAGEQLLVAEAA